MTKTALLVIDVQVGFLEGDYAVYEADKMLQRVLTLIDSARKANVPVIFVQHDEALEYDGPMHPTLAPLPDEPVIHKMTPDAFHETELHATLEASGVTQLILAGFQTEYCIQATSNRAHAIGYDVVVVQDTHSTIGNNGRSALEIISEYNDQFSYFAHLAPAHAINFR